MGFSYYYLLYVNVYCIYVIPLEGDQYYDLDYQPKPLIPLSVNHVILS